MYSVWEFFIRKKAFSYLLLTALVLFGFFSVLAIPKESAPEVQIPIAIVTTVFPGASAEDVEKLVTDIIEDKLETLENLSSLTSTSREGVSSVVVEFDAHADIDSSVQDVKDAVDTAKRTLPGEAEEPNVSEINFVDQPIMLVSISSDVPAPAFIQLADDVARELESVSGISRVEKSGIRDREVQIIVQKEKLHTFGIGLTDVVSALSAANISFPIGSITTGGIEYAIQFEGDIQNTNEIQNVPVATIGGRIVYVRDVAFVSDGVSTARSFSRTSINGTPAEQAATLSVFKRSGGDITSITRSIREKLADLEGGILGDASVLVVYDTGEFVLDDLRSLSLTGLQTVLLVMLILFVVLGWREALIAGSAIPLSFLIAFIGLWASGNTINFVSLFSLILAVGILVDSAIVVVEGIHARRGRGRSGVDAARRTIREFAWPLISGTLTTVAVFAPLFFISGVTGKFIASIPFTVIFVLLASLFVALGMVPLIASRALGGSEHSNFAEKQNRLAESLRVWYTTKLQGIVGNKKRENTILILTAVAFCVALLLPITGVVQTIFFPQSDSPFIVVEIEKEQGTTLQETDIATRAIEELLYDEPVVESFTTTVGAGSFFVEGSGSGPRFANITLILRDDRKQTSTEILEGIEARLGSVRGATVHVTQPSDGPPTGAPLVITLSGDDFDSLESTAFAVEDILKNIPGTRSVESSLETDGIDFVLSLNRERVAEAGILPIQIAQTLRTAVAGTEATSLKISGKDIAVFVGLDLNTHFTGPDDRVRTTIDALRSIEINTRDGAVPLGTFFNVRIERSNGVIRHDEGKRIATISSQIDSDTTAATVRAQFNEAQKKLTIPETVVLKVSGETEDVDQSFRDMFVALLTGMVLILAILVLQFNSFRQAFFIISIVPLSLIGIMFGLAVSRTTLSFPSMMGFIALAGIVVNNAIIMIDIINSLRGKHSDRSIAEVVIEGSASRLRPILLTTLTTVIGLIPLTYASELWAPLAFAVIFGLSFAVLLTLLIIPILYSRWPGEVGKESV
jgi:HAE1 family hydrophobic/amphiphilic exporter-1